MFSDVVRELIFKVNPKFENTQDEMKSLMFIKGILMMP